MKWQKIDKNPTTKYHLVIGQRGNILDGACGRTMLNKPELQTDSAASVYMRMCRSCQQVWGLVCTSRDDARTRLDHVHDVGLVKAAVTFAKHEQASKSLIQMLEFRVRKMEKGNRQSHENH